MLLILNEKWVQFLEQIYAYVTDICPWHYSSFLRLFM